MGMKANEYWTICSAYHTRHWSHNLIRNYQVAGFLSITAWTFLPLAIPSPYRTSLLATDWWLFIPQNMIKGRWRQGYYYQWYFILLESVLGSLCRASKGRHFSPPFIRHLYLFSYFTDERAITNPAVDINVIMAGLLYHITSLYKHFIGRIMVYTESCSFHVETVRYSLHKLSWCTE